MFFLEMSSGILLRKLQLITAKCFAIKCQQLPRHVGLNSGLGMNIFNSKIPIAYLNISIEVTFNPRQQIIWIKLVQQRHRSGSNKSEVVSRDKILHNLIYID